MKTRHYTTLLLLLFSSFITNAQSYGNEWIAYNQSYYTFQIHETGIYKLDYATLNASGIPLSSFQSDNIQIVGKEKEIPIHVADGGDNSIDPGDYVLFYAERNDGWLDSTIFVDPNHIGNPGYSLYNDTLLYFFTWNSSTNNSRYVVESDVNFSAFSSVSDFIIEKHETSLFQEYFEGVKISNASSSFYTAGEGWGKTKSNGASGGHISYLTATTPSPYSGSGAPNAVFTGRSVSVSDASTSIPGGDNHHSSWVIGVSNTILQDTTWKGYKQNRAYASFNPTLLSNGNTTVQYQIIGDLNALTDFQSPQYFSIEYPRALNFNGSSSLDFEVLNDPQGKIRLDIVSAGYNQPLMLVHGDTPRIVPFVPNGGFHSVLIPNSGNGASQSVIYKDSSMILNVGPLTAVNENGSFTDFSTANLEGALILIYHPLLQGPSEQYEVHRTSLLGGSYNVLMGNVEELYLQFGGGVQKHTNGVRRFVDFVYDNSTAKPVGLFLMGKGLRESTFNLTTSDGPGTRQNAARFGMQLIPSFGQPSSDVAITASLVSGGTMWSPLMPTGRISARDSVELQDYLNKVIEYEAEQDPMSVYNSATKDWQKHVIHFAGGSNATEHQLFQSNMNSMESKIATSFFGADVMRVYKSSSNPLDPTILSGVTDRISEGVSLMSYFGHASGTNSGFEINLDDAANWDNQGKYPVMLVNSCYNGNIFQATNSKSEEFVQVANYGAIAYIASVGLGFANTLNDYCQNFYTKLSNTEYGSTLGQLMKSNIESMQTFNSLTLETTCMQMVLNGDPMLKINPHLAPEIEMTPQNISFSPTDFNLTVDSITVEIDLKNLGQSIADTFYVVVERNIPNSAIDSIYIIPVLGLDYTKTVTLKMPLQPNIAVGINNFNITVDIPSTVPEQYDEIGNNQVLTSLFINIDGIVPVVPYEFAVVPDSLVTVKASTVNPIGDFNTYRFEIDTVDFEGTVPQSGEYRYSIQSSLGGVKEVNPMDWNSVTTGLSKPLVCEDSTVYFWRTSIVGDDVWQESSFQYIKGKTGWGQDHFYQFKKNGFFNIDYDRLARRREFAPNTKQLECVVNGFDGTIQIYYNRYSIDGNLITYGIGAGLSHKLLVAVLDSVTLEPWGTYLADTTGPFNVIYNPNNQFGNNNNNNTYVWKYFTFLQSDPAQLAAFQNMVLDSVPNGQHMLIYSPMGARYDLWDALDSVNMYNTFAALGSDSIYAGRPNHAFAMYVKKGYPSSSIENVATSMNGETSIVANMVGDNTGLETSTTIGPASNWESIHWKQDPDEAITFDTTALTIKAFNIFGVEQISIDTLFSLNDSIINLNPIIDASLYPYINLTATYRDPVNLTPAQVDRWHVLFTPLPEAAIDGTSQYTWTLPNDTLQEGEDVQFAVDVKNIYTIDMDSLLISYWVEDKNNTKQFIAYPRQDSLKAGQVLRDTMTFSTVGLGGINSLWMEVNPYVNGSLYITDQPEQEHFNNLLQIPFFVKPDNENPILDVTFNGNHILNGDIIDPNSELLITLKDDNDFLIMDNISDTTLFGIYLTDPNGLQKRIPFDDAIGNTVMQWVPATSQNKRFKIIWPAEFTLDGTYTLFVQGADRSGNVSGEIEYKVTFEIIHESTITAMMNYPNPFSTSTRFVFTLTGSDVPDDIIIQIMTVTGRVVREITEDQLGLIQIGRNITEYAWDGTDEFGDPLANGVYLYRVKALINGESIEHRASGADQYFKKDFGKMYLMR